VGEKGRHWELHRDPPMVSCVGPMTQSFAVLVTLMGLEGVAIRYLPILTRFSFFYFYSPPFKYSPCQLPLFLTHLSSFPLFGNSINCGIVSH
jgi:hypothetical protein